MSAGMKKVIDINKLITRLERWKKRREQRGSTNNADLVAAMAYLDEYCTYLINERAES